MPTYEYQCGKCGFEFEREQRITEDPIKSCPECRSRKVKRLLSATGFILKGGGWYADGYGNAKGGGKSTDSSSDSSSNSSEGSGSSGDSGGSSSTDSGGSDKSGGSGKSAKSAKSKKSAA